MHRSVVQPLAKTINKKKEALQWKASRLGVRFGRSRGSCSWLGFWKGSGKALGVLRSFRVAQGARVVQEAHRVRAANGS